MKLKLDAQGHIVLQDGHPVYVHDDGTEAPFDAKASHVALATAKREAAESRKALKDTSEKLAAFGDADPAAVTKAMALAASMEGKKVMDDEGIQRLVQSAVKPLQEKLTAQEQEREALNKELYAERVSKQFATSAFIADKTILTPDIAEAAFGRHFVMEGGKVVAKDAAGNPIYSTARAGELATFDEAIVTLVNAYPLKDKILRATGQSGSGAQPSNGGGSPAPGKYDHLKPADRITAARADGLTA